MASQSHLRDRESHLIQYLTTTTPSVELVSSPIEHKDGRGLEIKVLFDIEEPDYTINVYGLVADDDTPGVGDIVAIVEQAASPTGDQLVTIDLPMASHKFYKIGVTTATAVDTTIIADMYNFRTLGRAGKIPYQETELTDAGAATVVQIDCDVVKGVTDITNTF